MNSTLLPTQILTSMVEGIVRPFVELEQSKVQLKVFEAHLSHQEHMYGMKANLLRDLVHSLIERRVEAVQKGFHAVLMLYVEQSRRFMRQQEKYADAAINAKTPRIYAATKTRLNEIDLQLTSIRKDASTIYAEMNKVIVMLGGTMPILPSDARKALGLMDM